MMDKRTKIYFRDVFLSLLCGFVTSILIHFINSLYSIYFDLSGVVVKILSVVSALLLGIYFKTYKDEENKIKELKLPDESPQEIKDRFYYNRDSFYLSASNRRHLFYYVFSLLLMILIIFSMPLDQVKAKGVEGLAFVFLGSGLNVSTLAFCFALAFYINRQTDNSRKARLHFSATVSLEEKRKSLINNINENIRKEIDQRVKKPIEDNAVLDVRAFIESLEEERKKQGESGSSDSNISSDEKYD